MNRIAEALCAALREPRRGEATSPSLSLTPAEWHQVAALAIRQRVGPLLLSRKHLPFPDEARAVLRTRAELSARRVLLQQAAFRELADAVAPLGITLVALKGIHLATTVYPSAALREMNDIDVLVRPEDVEKVAGVMLRGGFSQVEQIPFSVAFAKFHHLPRFFRGPVGVEIHWRIAPPGWVPFTDAGLWSRTEALGLRPNAKALSAADALLHICAHAAEHHQMELGLRTLCDVHAVVAKSGNTLDWHEVASRSQVWKCQRALGLVLSLARDHLGTSIPSRLLDDLGDAVPPPEVRTLAIDQVFDREPGVGLISEAAGRLIALPYGARMRLAVNSLKMTNADSELVHHSEPGLATSAMFMARRLGYLLRHYVPRLFGALMERDGTVKKALHRRNALVAWLREP